MKDKELCRSCGWLKHASFKNEEVYYCGLFEKKLRYFATSCNSHTESDTPVLRYMEKMAWIFNKERKAGFEKPMAEFERPAKTADHEETTHDTV